MAKIEIPPVPTYCLDPDCARPTVVAFAKVQVKGSNVTGPFSRFGHLDHGVYTLNEGVDFVRWVTRCAECYDRDVRAVGGCSNPFNPFSGKMNGRLSS